MLKVVFPQEGWEGIPVSRDAQSHQPRVFMALCLFGPVIYWQLIQGGTPTRPQPSASGRTTHSVKALAPINLFIRKYSNDSVLPYPWIGSMGAKLIGK